MRCVTILTAVLAVCSSTLAWAEPAATQPAVDGELRPILSPEQQRERAGKLIDRFVAHVQASDVEASAKQAVKDAWAKHRDDEQVEEFLTAGLAMVSKSFKSALTALDAEQYTKADATLSQLVKSEDPYLSLHARILAARSLVEQDKLEPAEAILAPLAGDEKALIDKSFDEVEVDFLLGYCQLANLRYEQALHTLARFEREHPEAPDRFRLPARQMLQELRSHQPESLGEVSDLMTYSGRRMMSGEMGKPVVDKQARAVALLTKLIEQAEEQEKQKKGCKSCGGKGCKKCQGGCKKCGGKGCKSCDPKGNQQSNSPAKQSMLPGGEGTKGELDRTPDAKPGDVWGQMRPEERKRVIQSLGKHFPARYRALVEQYYKQLATED